MEQHTLNVQNLKCSGCEKTVRSTLEKIPEITVIDISADNNSVTVKVPSNEALELTKKQLHKIGYPLVGNNNDLGTKAKSYISCAIGKL